MSCVYTRLGCEASLNRLSGVYPSRWVSRTIAFEALSNVKPHEFDVVELHLIPGHLGAVERLTDGRMADCRMVEVIASEDAAGSAASNTAGGRPPTRPE